MSKESVALQTQSTNVAPKPSDLINFLADLRSAIRGAESERKSTKKKKDSFQFEDVQVVNGGTQITLPEGMSN